MSSNLGAPEISQTVCRLVRERLEPLLRDFGLTPALFADRISVEMSDLGPKTLGQFTPQGGWRLCLSFNARCWTAMSDFERIDIVAHELAHAVDYVTRGQTNHDSVWRAWANLLGARPRAYLDCETPVTAALGPGRRVRFFNCAGCNKRLRCPPAFLRALKRGREHTCPGCGHVIQEAEAMTSRLEYP